MPAVIRSSGTLLCPNSRRSEISHIDGINFCDVNLVKRICKDIGVIDALVWIIVII